MSNIPGTFKGMFMAMFKFDSPKPSSVTLEDVVWLLKCMRISIDKILLEENDYTEEERRIFVLNTEDPGGDMMMFAPQNIADVTLEDVCKFMKTIGWELPTNTLPDVVAMLISLDINFGHEIFREMPDTLSRHFVVIDRHGFKTPYYKVKNEISI